MQTGAHPRQLDEVGHVLHLHLAEGLDEAAQVLLQQRVVQRAEVRRHDGVVLQLALEPRQSLHEGRGGLENRL